MVGKRAKSVKKTVKKTPKKLSPPVREAIDLQLEMMAKRAAQMQTAIEKLQQVVERIISMETYIERLNANRDRLVGIDTELRLKRVENRIEFKADLYKRISDLESSVAAVLVNRINSSHKKAQDHATA